MNTTLPLQAIPAAPILARYSYATAIEPLLNDQISALELLDAMVNRHQYESAIDFLSYWMPVQYAVWWGCLCVWEVERQQESEALDNSMRLIVGWLQEPSEENRRRLQDVEQWYSTRQSIGLLAKAAMFSNGSMAPSNVPAVAPPAFLFAKLVSGAVRLVAAQSATPADHAARHKQILRLGMEVVQGVNLWAAVED